MTAISDHALRAAALVQSNHPAAWYAGNGKVLTPDEQLQRISTADPLGFLLAVFAGEPLLSFRLEPISKRYRKGHRTGGKTSGTRRVLRAEISKQLGVRVLAEYWTPSISDRITAARALHVYQLPVAQRPQTGSQPVDRDPEHTRIIQDALTKGSTQNGNDVTQNG